MTKKDNKPQKKLDPTDCALIGLSTVHPTDSLQETSDKLRDIKPLSRTGVYKRLTRSEYLKENIAIVRENNSEFLTRELVSPALRDIKKKVKDKSGLDDKLLFSYHKLIFDKEFGADDSKRLVQPIQVNIGQIQALIAKSITLDKD